MQVDSLVLKYIIPGVQDVNVMLKHNNYTLKVDKRLVLTLLIVAALRMMRLCDDHGADTCMMQ